MNISVSKYAFKYLLALFLFCSFSVNSAEEIVRGQTVQQHAKTDYQARGVRAGAFIITPTFESQNEYRDNIYSRPTNTVSDFIFHIKPGLNVRSDWSRHALEANIVTDIQFFATHDSENKQNYSFDLGGRLDVVKNSFAKAKFYYDNRFEMRGAPDSLTTAMKPVEYDTTGGEIGYEHKINRVRLNVSNDTKHLSFANGITGSGQFINNHDRNRLHNISTGRIGYEIMPGYEGFIRGSYNFVDYDDKIDDNGFNRSSNGYEVVSGIALDLTGKLVGDAYIGYRSQTYDDPKLKSIGGIGGGLGLKWMPTGLTTVTGRVDRSIAETTLNGSSGSFNTATTLTVDHELLRNVMLSANVGYTQVDFRGGSGRQDDIVNVGLSGNYLVNRNLYVSVGYNYATRSSNIAGNDYDINSVFLTVGARI